MATLSPEIAAQTITVGSAGKNFYCTGWRVGYLIGPANLIHYVAAAHTRICFSSVSPLQEAAAVGFERAEELGFWEQSRKEMQGKVERFCAVFEELRLPVCYCLSFASVGRRALLMVKMYQYSKPEGGYFVLANFARVHLPENYYFPPHVAERTRDFKLSWFLIMELGVAAIPPTEFYTKENMWMAEDWLRFAVCKEDDVLEGAKERLRGLRKYMQ